MKGRWLTVVLMGSLVPLQTSCEVDAAGPGNQANDRISITNDAAALAARITYYDSDVPVDNVGVGYPAPAAPMTPNRASQAVVSLKLVAEVAPPSIGGQMLQATSVVIVDDRAVVSYNMRGAQYLGAIDVFDVSNKNKPVLRSSALFKDTDINAVSTYDNQVLVAEATGDPAFATPAVLEVMYLKGAYLVLDGNQRWALSSYAATSAMAASSGLYATSGDNGGLFAMTSPPPVPPVALHDARWVDVGEGKVVVVQGTPGQIAVFDVNGLAPLGTFSFSGADIPESKSTVELVGGKAFVAAGSGGLQVLSASSGAVLGSVARPDPAALGLDPSVVVTNAASVDDDLVFIANGEAGVYVAQGSQAFLGTGSDTPQQLTMIGRLRFGDLESVNHVTYRKKNLIVAAGLGGLKIVKVQ